LYFYLADLKKDILNGPYHRLGQHINFDDYFCSGTKVGEKNLVPDDECLANTVLTLIGL